VSPAFELGTRYRDTGSFRDLNDQFLRWIRGPLDSGIKNVGGIRTLGAEHGDTPAALVLVSNAAGVSQHADPWEDTIAVQSGYVEYWGDGTASNPYDESPQNERIVTAFERASAGRREEVPPILVFQKPETGVVEFCGLCVPDGLEVRSYVDQSGTRVPNYLFHLSILNAPEVPVSWLHHRAQPLAECDAPEAWREWIETGTARLWPLGESFDGTGGQAQRYEQRRVTVSEAFRETVFERYDERCALTGIEGETLLDLAHVLPRSERPDLAESPENVLVLNALHHRAFDRHLFTIDGDYRLRVNPAFDPNHPFLRKTIVERRGEEVSTPVETRPRPGYLEELNAKLAWL
jgi:Predicted restriction endonuclease